MAGKKQVSKKKTTRKKVTRKKPTTKKASKRKTTKRKTTTSRKPAKKKTAKRKVTKKKTSAKKTAKKKAVKRKTTKKKVTKRKATKKKVTKRKATKRKTAKRKTAKRKTSSRKAAPVAPAPKASAAEPLFSAAETLSAEEASSWLLDTLPPVLPVVDEDAQSAAPGLSGEPMRELLAAPDEADHHEAEIWEEPALNHRHDRREQRADAADLFGATKLGQAEEVRRLLEHGADPDLTDDPRGEHREVVAFMCRNEDLGQVDLEGMKVGRTACHLAVKRGHTDILRALIEGGCDVNQADHAGETPLMLAARGGFAQLVRLLVQAGAQVDARDLRGATALLRAADAGHTDVVRTLLEARADVDARDCDERTALMASAAAVHEETVRLLLETEADLGLRDATGADALCAAVAAIEPAGGSVSPFQVVSEERILPIVALLVESGAKDEPDGMGVRPSRRAEERGHERIARILQSYGS